MRRRKTAFFKDKTFVIAAALCILAVGAMATYGIFQETNNQEEEQNLVDLNELPDNLVADNDTETAGDSNTNIATQETTTDDVEANNYSNSEFGMDNVMDATDEVIVDDASTVNLTDASEEEDITEETTGEVAENPVIQESDSTNVASASTETEEAVATQGSGIAINFTEDSSLAWPVDGNVILNYSMDKTVYFATLNQYKYNPALIIQANESDAVIAAANGTILSITNDSQTGLTVTMDIGNGYQVVYGQLQNISAVEGATLGKGELLGYVAAPSKYYVEEGTNVYFEVLKNNEPVNPMNYLE